MNRIQAIIFDKDGTLFGFRATWSPWIRELIDDLSEGSQSVADRLSRRLGFDYEQCEFVETSPFVHSTPEFMLSAVSSEFKNRSASEIVEYLKTRSEAATQVEAVPLRPLLAELRRRGYRLGIATNDYEAAARSHLATANSIPFFDFIAGFDSGFGRKPDPGMIHAFCDEVEIAPENTVMVGDSRIDIEAARYAGASAIGVLTGVADVRDLEPGALCVLQDIGQLPDWLRAMEAEELKREDCGIPSGGI
ncbi:MAG: HAD family hydrolase [Albidovulum sp.]|nr:HAD family hydrolase [Albidovulum sp.]MDE0531958.1 HAD family hydrolase [Albidovulum sp.]